MSDPRPTLAENDGPECETCGRTTCPDADLPGFSAPRQCAYASVYEELRYDRCEYGCGRDITNATVRSAVRAFAEVQAAALAEDAAEPAPVADDETRHGPWDKESQRYEDGCREGRPHPDDAPVAESRPDGDALAAVRRDGLAAGAAQALRTLRAEAAAECAHANVRTFRSIPPHSQCLDCGASVERVWRAALAAPDGGTSETGGGER